MLCITMHLHHFQTNLNALSFITQLFEFKELKGSWVAKMASDLNSKYIYAFLEQSVYVLCPQTRAVVSTLSEIHAQPVTACVWYPLGQFFLTGCRFVLGIIFGENLPYFF